MPLIASNKGGNFPVAPQGLKLARIYGIIDLGTHDRIFEGKNMGSNRMARVMFELPNDKHVFIEEKGPEPFTLSIKFPLSTHEKAKLRKYLKGWKGRDMTPEEEKSFDIETLLGKVCYINISHKAKKAGGMRAEIESINPIPKELKDQIGAAIMKPILYNTAQGRDATFNLLQEWIQKEIAASHEFSSQPSTGNADATHTEDTGDDDVPF